MCCFIDLQRHNPSLLKALETACKEAIEDKADVDNNKRKRAIISYVSKIDEPSNRLREALVKRVCLSFLSFSLPQSPGFSTVLSFLGG